MSEEFFEGCEGGIVFVKTSPPPVGKVGGVTKIIEEEVEVELKEWKGKEREMMREEA